MKASHCTRRSSASAWSCPSRVLAHDQPIVVTIIDSEENVRRILPIVEEMMDKGLIALSDVEMFRVQKPGH
jgi:PII-like signaling protein